MTGLLELLILLFRAFVPAAMEAARDTAEDGDPNVELRDRLHTSIRESWGRHLAILFFAVSLSIYIGGCGTRTIYVPDGSPVRIRETVKSAKVWVLDKDGEPVPSVMDIPAGWFTLAAPPKD